MREYTKEQLIEMASAPLDRDELMGFLADIDPKELDKIYDAAFPDGGTTEEESA